MTLAQAFASWGDHDRDDPFPLFVAIRERGSVHRVILADGHHAWLVIGHPEARSALNDTRLSKDMLTAMAANAEVVADGLPGPAFSRHMLSVDPPDHTRLRRLVSAAFSVRRVARLEPRVQIITDDLLDDVAAEGPDASVDLVARFAFPLPFTVICELLGVPGAEREELGREFTTLLAPARTPEAETRARQASDAVVGALAALVEQKRAAPGDDLVSALLAAHDGEEHLDEQEMLSTIFQLMVAGHDTTASLIGNSVVALLRNPGQLSTFCAEAEGAKRAIEELMRFDAPVPHSTFRYALDDVELGGVTIPKGAQVVICLAGANRDPDLNADPDVLDLQRDEVKHLAFGHGIHHCLGAPLARMEGQRALGTLFRRFPEMRLAVPSEELHWGHGDGLVLRGLSELPVVPGPSLPRG
jgi:cytochrome P450